MPSKSAHIKIEGTSHDRRIKLTEDQREDIAANRMELSHNRLAKLYKVSRRTISFILDPDREAENKKRREERGGHELYYDKKRQNKAQKEHRKYKDKLLKKGEINEKDIQDND